MIHVNGYYVKEMAAPLRTLQGYHRQRIVIYFYQNYPLCLSLTCILTSSSMLQHLKGKEAKYNKEYHCKDSGRGTYSLLYYFFLELFVLIGEIQMDILLCEQT